MILQLIRDDNQLSELEKRNLTGFLSSVRKQRNWYRMDLGFPLLKWYHRNIGFSHPEKASEIDFRVEAAKRTKLLDALRRDYLIFSELSKANRTAREIAMTHCIREEYVRESLRYQCARGRVTKCGKLLKRKKAAARWGLTGEGRGWLQTLDLVNRTRRRDFVRKMMPTHDLMRYRWSRTFAEKKVIGTMEQTGRVSNPR